MAQRRLSFIAFVKPQLQCTQPLCIPIISHNEVCLDLSHLVINITSNYMRFDTCTNKAVNAFQEKPPKYVVVALSHTSSMRSNIYLFWTGLGRGASYRIFFIYFVLVYLFPCDLNPLFATIIHLYLPTLSWKASFWELSWGTLLLRPFGIQSVSLIGVIKGVGWSNGIRLGQFYWVVSVMDH